MAKRDRGIRLSPKHGVNPSVMQCFYCGKDMGVALLGKLPGDREAPRRGIYDRQPCTTCEAQMAQGIMLCQVRDGESGQTPYRTGPLVVVRESMIQRVVNSPELIEHLVRVRFGFVPQSAWRQLGLPEEVPNGQGEAS